MEAKRIQTFLIVLYVCGVASLALAQEIPLDIPHRGADPNNGLIEGRVLLPSGQSASANIKIVLSDLQNPLTTFYTNKHAEFRLPNLSEGVYYVKASGDEKLYEPVTATVRLARSQNYQLTLTLRLKATVSRKPDSQVVSASEFKQAIPPAARKKYEQGVKAVEKGNVYQAVEQFQQALVLYPDYIAAHNDLGAQYLKLKQVGPALTQFQLALEQNPKYFNARFNLALVRVEQKNYAEAVSQLRLALALDSSQPAAHLWLGIALLDLGDPPGAERALSKALIMGGQAFAAAHFYLAKLYLKRGETTEAVHALKAYLAELPGGEYAEEAKLLVKKLETGQPPQAKSP
jgi:tetratricopeptide (TPR) repeat protein